MKRKGKTLRESLTRVTIMSFITMFVIIFTIVFIAMNIILTKNLKSELVLKADANAAALNGTISDWVNTIDVFAFELEQYTDCSVDTIKNAIDTKYTTLQMDKIVAFYVAYGESNYLYETLGWTPDSSYSVKGRSWYDSAVSASTPQVLTYADANTEIYSICKRLCVQWRQCGPLLVRFLIL